ncbi:MAG: phytoene/squalene synthase family protein [Rhodococcus sp.]|nr:phytoene/squalene synthase family protein [Rhodococcus sp. (in: high G+C Gram-positive bacteria)]
MSGEHSAATGEGLKVSYRECRSITAQHGRSYYLASLLLPLQRRRAIYALYAFARSVDDVVDLSPGSELPSEAADGQALNAARLGYLDHVDDALRRGYIAPEPETPSVPSGSALTQVLPAFFDTVTRFEIPQDYFSSFLQSMRMDVPGAPDYRAVYANFDELAQYMYGSAAVIGLQLLPILGTVCPKEDAAPYAKALGEAFQLTNFLRDVGEDLDRGRLYLPMDALEAFGVDTTLLQHCRRTESVDPRVRRALAHFIALARDIYRQAEPGIALLDPRVRPGIGAAFRLYSGILDEIERSGYRALSHRAVVPHWRRLAALAPRTRAR